VEAAFLKAAKRDRAQVTFLPISPLGVMEVARERLQGHQTGSQVVVGRYTLRIQFSS
jgi:Ribonuclease G/E